MIEIRRNIHGDVPPDHFYIMPVLQWRSQTPENTLDLTMDLDHLPRLNVLTSTLVPLHSPTRSAPLQRQILWHDWLDYTATPPSSPCRQRSTRMEVRTCTPVCCCPGRLELSSCGTGITKASIRTCRESGASQSGSLI